MFEYDSPYIHPNTGLLSWYYRPYIPFIEHLPGSRRTLIIDPRGWFKSTLNTFAHSVQWIINYPSIAIATIQSSKDKASDNCNEIRDVFRYNQVFRRIFPEHCPNDNLDRWGNSTEFTTCARPLTVNRKEKTVEAHSIDSLVSGFHFDLIKFADIVEEKNAAFETGREFIFKQFGAFIHILQAPASKYHIDMEGTPYHEDDTYGRVIKSELEKKVEEREWVIHIRGCYKKKSPDGTHLKYSIDELNYDDYYNEDGKLESNYPELEPVEALRKLEFTPPMTPALFACQKKCNPLDYDESVKVFPLKYLQVLKLDEYKILKENNMLVDTEVSIDTAETQNETSCDNVIAVAQWTKSNKAIIRDLRHGKFTAHELIENLYHIQKTYKPRCFYLEETGYNAGIKALLLERSRSLPHKYPMLPIIWLKRERTRDKDSRIQANLQPFYLSGSLHVLETIPAIDALRKQLNSFPKGKMKDILDAISDLFANRSFILNEVPETRTVEQEARQFFYGSREEDSTLSYNPVIPTCGFMDFT